MKKVLIGVGILVALLVLAFVVQIVAAESGEVVVVRVIDEDGTAGETRLWIVDDAGSSWLRAGSSQASWLPGVQAGAFEMDRAGETLRVRVIPEPAAQERIDRLMREKYGWGDAYIRFLVSREASVPLRLVPVSPQPPGSG
ncbi:MAG: hypothetical protein ABFS46_14995 [Myxococcota bacterium]